MGLTHLFLGARFVRNLERAMRLSLDGITRKWALASFLIFILTYISPGTLWSRWTSVIPTFHPKALRYRRLQNVPRSIEEAFCINIFRKSLGCNDDPCISKNRISKTHSGEEVSLSKWAGVGLKLLWLDVANPDCQRFTNMHPLQMG